MTGRALSGFAFAALLATLPALAMLPAGTAAAASLFELNFWMSGPRYDGALPPCGDQWALSKIAARFGEKENTFWNSSLSVQGFEHVRETAYRSWAVNTIPRRFCSATAQVSDGSKRPIFYSIGENTGMIGQTFGVEWCVVGLDRNWAYSPACKMARP
jgi:hypothetical protein